MKNNNSGVSALISFAIGIVCAFWIGWGHGPALGFVTLFVMFYLGMIAFSLAEIAEKE